MTMFSLTRRFDPIFDLVPSARSGFPSVNVLDDKDGLVIRLEVPGVPAENLSIESSGRTLTISGKRESDVPVGADEHLHEYWSGEFSRSLQLPSYVDAAKSEASYKHGMLTIRIPKREELQPRQIEIAAPS